MGCPKQCHNGPKIFVLEPRPVIIIVYIHRIGSLSTKDVFVGLKSLYISAVLLNKIFTLDNLNVKSFCIFHRFETKCTG